MVLRDTKGPCTCGVCQECNWARHHTDDDPIDQLLEDDPGIYLDLLAERDEAVQAAGRLRDDNQRLRTALGQYADQRNWFQTAHMQSGDFPTRVWAWDDAREPWSMAQKALGNAKDG